MGEKKQGNVVKMGHFFGSKAYGACPYCSAIIIAAKNVKTTKCNNCKAELTLEHQEESK